MKLQDLEYQNKMKDFIDKKLFCSRLCKHYNIKKFENKSDDHFCIIQTYKYRAEIKLNMISISLIENNGKASFVQIAFSHENCFTNNKKSLFEFINQD